MLRNLIKALRTSTIPDPRSPIPDPRGFTYVEILVTLSLVAILFIPMMQLFSNAMEATNTSRDLITAVNLARWEMERAKNAGVSTSRLRALGDTIWPPKEEPPLALNGRAWRVYRRLTAESDPLEVTVEARRLSAVPNTAQAGEGETKAVARLVTLITDTFWGQQRRVVP